MYACSGFGDWGLRFRLPGERMQGSGIRASGVGV